MRKRNRGTKRRGSPRPIQRDRPPRDRGCDDGETRPKPQVPTERRPRGAKGRPSHTVQRGTAPPGHDRDDGTERPAPQPVPEGKPRVAFRLPTLRLPIRAYRRLEPCDGEQGRQPPQLHPERRRRIAFQLPKLRVSTKDEPQMLDGEPARRPRLVLKLPKLGVPLWARLKSRYRHEGEESRTPPLTWKRKLMFAWKPPKLGSPFNGRTTGEPEYGLDGLQKPPLPRPKLAVKLPRLRAPKRARAKTEDEHSRSASPNHRCPCPCASCSPTWRRTGRCAWTG